MRELHLDSALKHERLKEAIRESLVSGEFKPGEQIPPELALVSAYRVSRATVREAVASLVHEGLLYRVQGKGTFVAKLPSNTPVIAVMMPFLFCSDPMHYAPGDDVLPQLIQGIEANARAGGINMLLYLCNDEPDIERQNLVNAMERGTDGLLVNYIGAELNDDCLRQAQAQNIPVVFVDRYPDGGSFDHVATDNKAGAVMAVKELIEQGYERIVFVTGRVRNSALKERLAGYREAMKAHGLKPDVLEHEGLMPNNVRVENALQRECAERCRMLKTPFAVFTSTAGEAAHANVAVQTLGLASTDYAIACFDEPYLNTAPGVLCVKVYQPLAEIGKRGVEILADRIRSKTAVPATPRHIRLTPRLVSSGR